MKKHIPLLLIFLFACTYLNAQNTNAFITTWKTTSANESITIPTYIGVAYNYSVDWGDGNTSSNQTSNATHTYATAGTHTVSITDDFPAIRFSNPLSDGANDAKLLTVEQWGTQVWQGMGSAFSGCKNLTSVSSTDVPILAPNSSLYGMFFRCSSFNDDLNNWDVSQVRETHYMFAEASSFNGNISDWDVRNVTNMANMFQDASAFNQNLNNWEVSKVTNMTYMFNDASTFNGNIGSWDVGKVTNMAMMFRGASAFNQGLNNWDVHNVTNMAAMFQNANSFDRNISGWDVSKVTDMSNMFRDALTFDGNLGGWDISNVTNMQLMLSGSGLSSANYDATLAGWATRSVQPNIRLGADGLTFCAGANARQSLIDNHDWTISGDRNSCLVQAQPDANGIVYVDHSVATPGDGSNWGQALQYLSTATESARINTAIKEIHVAKGTYYPTGAQSVSNRDSSFVITRGGLKLIGGYPNGGGMRNYKANPTLLSGDINAVADTADNSHHVMVMRLDPASTDSLVLDGFTITMGNANDLDFSSGSEGLFFFEGLGGGLVILALEPNTIAIRNNLFYKNYANGGAGMFMGISHLGDPSDPNAQLQRPSPFISNCIFKENAALSQGASSEDVLGGGGMLNFASAPLLDRCAFIGNASNMGGAIMNFLYATSIVKNSIITKNTAWVFSAAVASAQSGLTLINCLITENITTVIPTEDSEVLVPVGIGTVLGSGQNSSIRLINSTLSENKAANATNTSGHSIMSGLNSKSFITNSIIWGNQFNSIGDTLNSSSVISHSLVQGMAANAQNHILDGTIDQDPFVNISNDNYQLKPTSLAINAGRNDSILNALPPSAITDLAGNSRIYGLANGGIVDLGVYEYQGNPITPSANGIMYVDSAAAPGGDGSSWATALQSFGTAIQASDDINKSIPASADSVRQIWVADGTYQPESGQSFFMLANVKIYGGFKGTENSLMDRNLASGETSILLGNGTSVIRNDKNGLDTTSLLDGFKITGGTAVGAGSNNSGGGVFNRESSPAFSNLIINGNTASYVGGGVSNRFSSAIFTNVVISGNKAGYAGGMGNEASSPVLTNVTISGNRADRFGGGMENLTASSPVVSNSIIWGNVADEGNEIYNKDNSTLILTNSLYGNGTNDVFEADANTIIASDILIIDPLFVNAPAASNAPFTGGYYQLQSFSPAINAGTNDSIPAWDSTDVAGNSRIYDLANGGIVDMGAYEYQGTSVIIQPDVNGIMYVDSAAAPGGDGSSWTKALQSFGTAIYAGDDINKNATAPTDSLRQIWVAGGTYQTGTDSSFFMLPKVKIYGSFAGTEISLTERELTNSYTSILLGNGNSVIHNDNNNLDTSALLDGFNITGGNARGGGVSSELGGGICNEYSSPTLSRLVISGNKAMSNGSAPRRGGGGIYNGSSSPVLINIIISGNTAVEGGGIYNNSSSPILTNVIIKDNTAYNGGGIINYTSSSPRLTNVTISGNTAYDDGGGIYNENASPLLTNSILWGNEADNNGNEIVNEESSIALRNSLYGNDAGDVVGGGVTASATLTVAPLFADTANGNYQLLSTSPAINAGINDSIPAWDSTDVAGNSRIYDLAGGGVVDMGAYEYQGSCPPVVITMQPENQAVCNGVGAVFNVEAQDGTLTYQWQVSLDEGQTFTGLADNEVYSGAASPTLTIAAASSTLDGLLYRSIISSECASDTSDAALLGVTEIIIAGTPPEGKVGNPYNFTFAADGGTAPYTWSLAAGELPAGLDLNTETGELSGTPDSATTYEFTFLAEDASGCTATKGYTLTVVPGAAPVITFPEPGEVVYGAGNFDPDASSSDNQPLQYVSSDESVAIITPEGEIKIIGVGTVEIEASLPADPNYEDAEAVIQELVVNPAILTVTANDDSKTYDATAYSGGNGATVSGWQYDDTDDLLEGTLAYGGSSQGAVDVGSYEIVPSGYDALNNYVFGYQTGTLTIVAAGDVVINFPELDTKTYGDADFAPGATSSDDRQVEYESSDETVAVITAGGMIQIVGAGTADITAFLPKDGNFEDAEAIMHKLTVLKANPVITWNTPTAIIEGTALSAAQLNATADVAGSFSYDPIAGTILTRGDHILTVNFAPTDEANYNPAEETVTLTVTDKQVPVITWATPAAIVYGTTLTDAQLNATADVAGTFTYDPADGTILPTGEHILKVTLVPNDATYVEASKEVTLEVTKADWAGTPVTFSTIDPIVYDGEEHEITADDVPPGSEVTYTIIDGDGNEIPGNSITDAGDYTVIVVIRQDNFEDITVSTPVSIAKAQATITADALQAYTYDGTVKNAVASLNHAETTLGYGPQRGYTEVGTYNITVTATETANYLAANKEVTLEVTKADWAGTPVTFPTIGPIVYDGEEHEITVGNIPPGSEATYTIIDEDGNEIPGNSIKDAGDYTVVAIIHQDNYEDIRVSTPVSILPANRSLAFDAMPEKTYGDADFGPGGVASTGETVIYTSSNTAVAEIVEGKIHITGAGSANITATLAENANYGNRPSVSRELTVLKAPQSISFAPIGEVEREAGVIALDIVTSSGLPVTLGSSDVQVATVAGENQLEILRLGTSFITAVQPGNANYLPAEPVSRELKVVDLLGNLIKVHPVVSPNGDGINEFLLVEGIRDYPVNRMTVVNRNGVRVFQIENYDNSERVFRGLTNNSFSDRSLLPQGTYFYLLEIKTDNGWKRKTGWFVMKHSND